MHIIGNLERVRRIDSARTRADATDSLLRTPVVHVPRLLKARERINSVCVT